MSCPPKPMRPKSGASSPTGMSRLISSDATIPPKRLLKPSTRSKASVTARPQEHAVDPAAREQHDQQEDRADDDLPVFRHSRERLFQHQERHRADHRPEYRPHAAEHRHDDEVA